MFVRLVVSGHLVFIVMVLNRKDKFEVVGNMEGIFLRTITDSINIKENLFKMQNANNILNNVIK